MGSYSGDKVPMSSKARAAVLGIGTATPPNPKDMATFPDYYFRVTNSEHMVDLKKKFARICEKSTIKKKYSVMTEEMITANANISAHYAPSLDIREEMLSGEVPRLGMKAALNAIADWGGSLADITHLIFYNTSSPTMPGADYELTKLLGLSLSVKRIMLYQLGCYAGGTLLRLAKDIAENDHSARVLAVSVEIMSHLFRGPLETDFNNLVVQSLFGDGSAAVIVGAAPRKDVEHASFEIVSASQHIIPGSGDKIVLKTMEAGIIGSIKPDLPKIVSNHIEDVVKAAVKPFDDIQDLNDLFWLVHPGGPAILNAVEERLGLADGKLDASRETLSEYGNLSSATVLFVMEHMRKNSVDRGMATAGEGREWGMLLGFGPGITVEALVLRCP